MASRLADGHALLQHDQRRAGLRFVKDGKIIRMTPIDFGDDDPPPWTIGRAGSTHPPRKTRWRPWAQRQSIVPATIGSSIR